MTQCLLERFVNILLKLLIRLLQIIIHQHKIMHTRRLSILQLIIRLRQPLLNTLLRLRTASPKSLLQRLQARRRNKDVPRINRRLLNLLDALHFNVEHHHAPLGRLLLDGGLAGAVAVAAELGVLDEAVLCDQGLELLHGHEVVVLAVGLAGAGGASRVRDGEGEGVWVGGEEAVVEGAFADA